MEIKEKIVSKLYETKFFYKKHRPEILLIGGFIGIAGAIASMWNVKDKVENTLDIHEDKMLKLKEEEGELPKKEYKKEVTKVYISTAANMTKAIGPTVGLTAAGFLLIFGSYKDLKDRNLKLIAAYNVIDTAFKAYRKRVIEEEGADADRHYMYGTERVKTTETVVGEDGKKKKVTKTDDIFVNTSEFSRVFDRSHMEFHREEMEGQYAMNANFMWLSGIEAMMSRRLQIRHQVTLNEVYEALRMPKSYAGSFVGWRDIDHGGKSNYISFNISDRDKAIVNLGGGSYGILLEFDVDGVILDSKFDEISGANLFLPENS